MRLLVIGGTGGTGQAITRAALAAGHEVTALVRVETKAREILPGATLVEGDVRDREALLRALSGCDAVISALGTRKIQLVARVTVHSEGTRTLVDAMRQSRVRRLVCITGVGAGDSAGHGGFVYDWLIKPVLLRTIYDDKDRQEALVRSSGLDWIIVRPAVLTDGDVTGRTVATINLQDIHGGSITRADVAAFVVAQVSSDEWLGKTPLIVQRSVSGQTDRQFRKQVQTYRINLKRPS